MAEGSDAAVIDRFVYVPHYVVLIANAITTGASRTYFRTIGFGINESRVLSVLGHMPGLTQIGIAGALAMNKSIVSRSLQALVMTGCVTGEGPERAKRFTLTAAGLVHHDTIVRMSFARQERLLAGFDAIERRTLVAMLARLLSNVPAVNAYDPEKTPVADDRPGGTA